MITRDSLKQSTRTDPVTGNAVLMVSLNMSASDMVLRHEDTPEKREEIFEYLTAKAMRHIYRDLHAAINECYRDVMPSIGMGANVEAALDAFERLRKSIPK